MLADLLQIGLLVAIWAVGLGLLVRVISRRGHRRCRRADGLLDAHERSLLSGLERAVGPSGRVFSKVSGDAVIGPAPGVSKTAQRLAIERLRGHCLEYVICRSRDLQPLAVVELAAGAEASRRSERERAARARILADAGLAWRELPVQAQYSATMLRGHLAGVLPEDFGVVAARRPRSSASGARESPAPPAGDNAPAETIIDGPQRPLCPRCGCGMRQRCARSANGQRLFWICAHYPTCRGVRPDSAANAG